MDLAKLKEPFDPDYIEWRVSRGGVKNGRPWALVLAYVTSRAIMDRLDDVAGPDGWRNEYREGPGGGVLCGISIRVGEEWITKWDGAENTNIEAVKGGLSGAMKRAAVHWGIGRYLYGLSETFANIRDGGRFRGEVKGMNGKEYFKFDPPALPAWALPDGYKAHEVTHEVRPDDSQRCVKALSEIKRLLDDAQRDGLITDDEYSTTWTEAQRFADNLGELTRIYKQVAAIFKEQ